MRKLASATIVIFIAATLAFVGYRLYLAYLVDDEAPVISCGADLLQVSVKDGDAALLQDVTAFDSADGDLSSQVMVAGVTTLLSADTARVSYVVFDSSDNMGTASRMIRYIDYSRPRFQLDVPLTFAVGGTISLADKLRVIDDLDGDISDSVRVTANNISPNTPGVYSITVQVSNSLRDTSILDLPVSIIGAYTAAAVELKTYITYLDKGDSFEPSWYVKAVRDATGSTVSVLQATSSGSVNTNAEGEYIVKYTYSSGGSSATAYLVVVVR